VRGGLRGYCRNHIQFGRVSDAIGYLRVTTFYDYADVPGYAAEFQCLQKSLDLIFDSAFKLTGLIIDVRLNHGGYGWRFHLPNEVYLTSDGRSFDGTGVPPDTRVHFLSEADLQNGRDAALA
jgi:C-terminal processing protease CtpA/Prc